MIGGNEEGLLFRPFSASRIGARAFMGAWRSLSLLSVHTSARATGHRFSWNRSGSSERSPDQERTHRENLGSLGALAFDKTGTLTTGRMQLTDLGPLDGTHVRSS